MPTPPRKFKSVAVLMGGWSAEREVSLATGRPCADALEAEGYTVTRVDVGRDIAQQLAALKPDACFNALHGRWGEDGCIQGLLECLGIPYTHSGVLASSLAMHKQLAKHVMKAAGVPVPGGGIFDRRQAAREHVLPRPYVLKPVTEGSSVGVFIVRQDHDHPPQEIGRDDWGFGDTILAEPYVAGRELTCGVMGEKVFDVIEIKPAGGLTFYNYESKYAPGGSIHVKADDLSPDVYQSIQKYTLLAHQALGCRGVSRADFRLDDTPGGTGELVCLEVNTQPGMTATSLVPDLAGFAGLSFREVVRWVIEDASCDR
jgi:D-alanine-D-alanine ligase